MTIRDEASFSAGQDTGTRISVCVARMAAQQLVDDSTWWNRRRHRLMAGALLACAEELEEEADARRALVEDGPSREADGHGALASGEG